MTKWALAPVRFFIANISRWRNGCWSAYTFAMTNWAMPPYTCSFWKFRDAKMDVGLRTLFHFGSFTMTKSMLAPEHFTTTTNTHYGTQPKKHLCVLVVVPVLYPNSISAPFFVLLFNWGVGYLWAFCRGSFGSPFLRGRERNFNKWHSLELVGTRWISLELVGTRWNWLELVGTRWNSLELVGTRWNSLALVGTRWHSLALCEPSQFANTMRSQTVRGLFGARSPSALRPKTVFKRSLRTPCVRVLLADYLARDPRSPCDPKQFFSAVCEQSVFANSSPPIWRTAPSTLRPATCFKRSLRTACVRGRSAHYSAHDP